MYKWRLCFRCIEPWCKCTSFCRYWQKIWYFFSELAS